MSDLAKTEASQARGFELPRLTVADGTIDALKWLALGLMTLDHVNKYLLHGAVPALFDAGRVVMPLFGFVLAHNLARPQSLASGAYGRICRRLAFSAAISSVPFIALGGLGWGWWPLNIMVTLLVAAGVIYSMERGGAGRLAVAALLFVVGGANVEFWWPAIMLTVAAWCYVKQPSWPALLVWIAATGVLYVINRNAWALAAFLLIFAAPHIQVRLPRLRHVFYVYYPLHLVVLWTLRTFT